MTPRGPLVLSIFPGIGLLDRAFEELGFCVLRGPDTLWGGDIRRFHPPAGHFSGVIGGPPCQDFSSARRALPTGYGLEMLAEFARVVREACPTWWLMENVSRVPRVTIEGFPPTQRLDCDAAWFGHGRRLRHIQWASVSGATLQLPRGVTPRGVTTAALASDARSVTELAELQDLPADFDLPGFTIEAKKRAIGNGVPLRMGRALARAVVAAIAAPPPAGSRYCQCGCARIVTGRRTSYDASCRKRLERNRRRRAQSH